MKYIYEYLGAPVGARKIDPIEYRRGVNWDRYAGYVLIIALLGFAYLFVVKPVLDAGSSVSRAVSSTVEAMKPPPPTIEVDPIVLVQMVQEMFRVNTVSETFVTNVSGDGCAKNAFWFFFDGYCLKKRVTGKAIAGFDWNTFGRDRITATHTTIMVDIGSPLIQYVVPTKVEITHQSQGGFVSEVNAKIGDDLVARAITQIRVAACANKILDTASVSAQKRLQTLLTMFLETKKDTRTVKIVSRPSTC